MLLTVLTLNLLLALGGFYLAGRIWRLKKALAIAADALMNAEQATYEVLHGAPEAIQRGQIGAAEIKQRYQRLMPQLQRAQQAVALLTLINRFWWQRQQPWRRSPRKPAKKRR